MGATFPTESATCSALSDYSDIGWQHPPIDDGVWHRLMQFRDKGGIEFIEALQREQLHDPIEVSKKQ
jgi:hypothetical protein